MNPTEQFNQLESAKQSLLKMSEGLKTGALVPKTVPPPTTTTVDASKLSTQGVAFPPTPTPTPIAMPQPSIDEQAASFAQAAQPTAPTAAETAMTETQSRFKQLSEKLFGKSAAQQAAEQTQGIPQKSQAVADIQAQINQLQNEAQIASMRAEDRLAPTFAIAGEQAQVERARTIKALQLNSFLYAAQGSLAVAQDMADRAVKAEFEPIEQEIAFTREWLDLNKDNLSREEKKRAETLTLQLNERTRLLEEQKATKTAIQNIGLEAAKNGADAVTLRNIQNAKTAEEAIAASGAFLSTPQTDVIKLDDGSTIIYDKRTNQVVKNLGGAQLTPSGTGGGGEGIDSGTTISTITGKPLTEGERKALGYAERVREANEIIARLESQFTGKKSYVGQLLPNFLKTSGRQEFEQAQRNFVNAILRPESGAVISEEEFDNAREQYFPQPGDSPSVVAQKKRNRESKLQSLLIEGGQAVVGNNNDPLGLF